MPSYYHRKLDEIAKQEKLHPKPAPKPETKESAFTHVLRNGKVERV